MACNDRPAPSAPRPSSRVRSALHPRTRPRSRRSLLSLLFVAAWTTLLFASPGLARMYEEPRSFSLTDKSMQQVDREIPRPIDPDRLVAEDRERGKEPGRREPDRFAVTERVDFEPETPAPGRTSPTAASGV